METKIREAYDQMNPTPEQEERMLSALREAQGAQGARDAKAGADAGKQPAKRRNRLRAWMVAVPIAACLAAGAVAVGTFGQPVATTAPEHLESARDPDASSANAGSSVEMKAIEAVESADEAVAADEVMATDGMAALDAKLAPGPDGFDGSLIDIVSGTDGEEYAETGENGFIATSSRPLSTVSADVDTASYANLRRMLNDGYALDDIPDGAVRVEEMLNYFAYDYAKPTGDEPFAMQAQAGECPWNPDTLLLTIGFATPYETGTARNGANLVFLIDVSGSMDDPDKLELLQDSFATLLESLDGDDRVSIVTYSGEEEVVLEGAKGNDDQAILRAIYRLRAEGSTNGEAGLKMAYEVAGRNFIEGGVNRIVMASDGDLNVGASSTDELYELVDGERESGVYLSVLGFGAGNYKDAKMEALADHGNGSYHYIDCAEEAERVLKERLMANLVPFADDVKVQVEFNPAQVKGYRLIGYENRELPAEAFLDDAADAGDVGPNAQFTVAYEIVPADSPFEVNAPELKYGGANGSDDGNGEWLTCSLRYRAFSDGAVHEQQIAVDAGDLADRPSDDWTFASAVIEFGMIAEDSAYKGNSTRESVLGLLGSIPLDAERESFRDLVEGAREDGGGATATL